MRSRSFKSLAESSKRQYSEVLTKFELRYGMNEIDTIKRSDIVGMLDEMSSTPAMANRFVRVTSVLFSFALDHDYVTGNPASRLKKMKIGSWARWYPEEVAKVIALKDRVVSTAVALAWYTGQRESDVLDMK